jgi:hypothetical protein
MSPSKWVRCSAKHRGSAWRPRKRHLHPNSFRLHPAAGGTPHMSGGSRTWLPGTGPASCPTGPTSGRNNCRCIRGTRGMSALEPRPRRRRRGRRWWEYSASLDVSRMSKLGRWCGCFGEVRSSMMLRVMRVQRESEYVNEEGSPTTQRASAQPDAHAAWSLSTCSPPSA